MSTADLLGEVWLFHNANKASLEKLAAFAFNREYKAGDVIMEEGQTGNGMYMITEGKVEVLKGDLASPQRVAELGKGEVFGEMALLDELPRSASVRALEDTTCIGIDRFLFISQLQKDPAVAITMIQVLAERLREANENLMK